MSLLYLDDMGRAFRKRILTAMEEYGDQLLHKERNAMQAKFTSMETGHLQRAQAHNDKAFQELESIHKKYHDLNGDNPAANHMLKIARKYLNQWNAGKEVEQDTGHGVNPYVILNNPTK